MNVLIYVAIWTLLGLWSFIITQNIIKGWDFIKAQPNPFRFFISAMITGPITTLTCFYVLYKYFTIKK